MKFSACLSYEQTSFKAVPFSGLLEENIKTIADIGFDGVELAVRDPLRVEADALEKIVKQCKVAIPALGTGQAWGEDKLSFTSDSKEIRKLAIDRVLSHIPLAERFNSVIIIGLIRGIVNEKIDTKILLEQLHEALYKICIRADAVGVRVAFEPINRYETSLLNTVEEGIKFISTLGVSNLGMLLDTFHMNIEEPSIENSIIRAGKSIYHFHYADSNRQEPGAGHIDFASVFRVLQNTGYEGFISGEHMGGSNPLASVTRGFKYIKNIVSHTNK